MKVAFMSKVMTENARRAVGLLLIALIFGLGLASVYPDLHRALHGANSCASDCSDKPGGDSGDEGHICGVTLLQTGAVFCADSAAAKTVGPCVEVLEHVNGASAARASFILPPSRAPPIAGIV